MGTAELFWVTSRNRFLRRGETVLEIKSSSHPAIWSEFGTLIGLKQYEGIAVLGIPNGGDDGGGGGLRDGGLSEKSLPFSGCAENMDVNHLNAVLSLNCGKFPSNMQCLEQNGTCKHAHDTCK